MSGSVSYSWEMSEFDQSLVGHSLTLCSIFNLAILIGRTYFGVKFLCMGWCPHSFTGCTAWLPEMVTLSFISPTALSHIESHPHRLLGASPIQGLWHIPEMLPYHVTHHLLPPQPPSHPIPHIHSFLVSILFSWLSGIQEYSHEPMD